MKKHGSRMNVVVLGTLVVAPAAWAGLTPLSAVYTYGGTASSEGTITSEIDADSFSGGQSQPGAAPFGPFGAGDLITTSWQDASFPALQATGNAHAALDALAPAPTGWSVSGTADVTVSGDFFNGALGKGHAWAEATFTFSLDALTAYQLAGSVVSRSPVLIDPTWVNFTEAASVELWQGTTLLHRAAGGTPGAPVAFNFSGTLPAGEYRVEARARARTESLAFGQPWTPIAAYDALLVIPGAPVLGLAVCAAPITLRRRR